LEGEKMKKNFIFILLVTFLMSSIVVMGATLEKLTFSATEGMFQAELVFDSPPSYSLKSVLGNSPVFAFKGNVATSVQKETEWGPAKATISSTSNQTLVKFDFPFVVSTFAGGKVENPNVVVVSFVTLGISQKLALSGTATKISIDFSGEKGSTLGLAIKYLARILKRNLIIDPKVSSQKVNVTLSNVTPSEAFYDILISLPGIGYAILPDGTYYIAPINDLVKNVGKLGVGTYNNIVSFYDLSTTNVSSTTFSSLVTNLFGNNRVIDYIGSYAIVKATAEQQKTIESLMDFLKEGMNFSTVEWTNSQAESDLQKLIEAMYPTLKFMYLPTFSTIVMTGSKTDLQGAKNVIDEYAQILSENGPKVSVTFEVPNSNVPVFLQYSKATPYITAYGSPSSSSSNTVYIVTGPQKQVETFENSVKLIASTLTAVKARPLHFNFASWTDKNSVNDLLKMISIMYSDVKSVYFPSFGQILFYGQNANDVDDVVNFVKKRKPLQTVGVKKTTVTVNISSRNLLTVNALLRNEFPTLFGTGTQVGTSENVPYVVSGPATDVNKFVSSLKNTGLIVGKAPAEVSKPSETIFLNEVPWADEKSANDVLNLLKIKYPNLKAEYLKSLKEFAIYGLDASLIKDASTFVNSHLKTNKKESIPMETKFIKIAQKDYETVKAMIRSKDIAFFGPTNPSTLSTIVTIGMSGPASSVAEVVQLLKTSNLISKVTPRSSASSISTTQGASVVQIVSIHNDLVSCDVKNYPLSTLIERVYDGFGKNVIFASSNLPSVNLKLSNITLDEFKKAVENAYKLSFTGTSVIVVENSAAGITRVYMSSDDVNAVKSIAAFVGGKTFVDEKKGIIVVSNLTPNTAEKLDSLVKPLLASRKDVKIEAKILDVTGNKNVQTDLKTTLMTPQLIFNNGLNIDLKLLDISNVPKFLSGFGDQVLSSKATITGNFSDSTGDASMLSAPVVTTQSGEAANILIGSKYPYMVTTVANGQQQQQLKFLDTGIQLNIVPVILPNKKISLTITIEVSDADWAHAVNGIPAVNTRSASMKVVVSDGQTLMIGGLVKHSRSQNVVKIPFLGDLPFIGQFFRTTTFQDSTSNLDILITAKVGEE
jgi:type II secretory pathway component GspD/PulD (secretin)